MLMAAFALAPGVLNASSFHESSRFEIAEEALTNPRIWKIAPYEKNPHLRVWALDRQLQVLEFSAVESKKKKEKGKAVYRIRADQLTAVTRLHLRPGGPWYSLMDRFPCTAAPQNWFHTREGAIEAGTFAGKEWNKLVKAKAKVLNNRLDQLSAELESVVLIKARLLFDRWLEELTEEFTARVLPRAEKVEWEYYRKLAKTHELCKSNMRTPPRPLTRERMPHPSQEAYFVLRARAPASRWTDGAYSVRVVVQFLGKKLIGKFLIDSSAEQSVISEEWLNSQGINPDLISEKRAAPQKIQVRRASVVATPTLSEGVSVSGETVDIERLFIVPELDLFGEPEFKESCCDGILGNDFLRLYAVEFDPAGSALKLYDREAFSLGSKTKWIAVRTTENSSVLSEDCYIGEKSDGGSIPVQWSTARLALITVPHEKRKEFQSSSPAIGCPDVTLLSEETVLPSRPDYRLGASRITLGAGFLARGKYVMDLANGRIWTPESFLTNIFPLNETGLELKYVSSGKKGRALKVTAISPKSPAADFARNTGLKTGMTITKINGTSAESLNQFRVDQILKTPGNQLLLQWRQKDGEKIAPFNL